MTYRFPDPSEADDDGLLCLGGDLAPERLLAAYRAGIFPWYDASQPILWWSPNPRMVLFPDKLHVSKSMERLFLKRVFTITYNQEFERVIAHCASIERRGQFGTWLTPDMIAAYTLLHKHGFAHSVEVWKNGKLVGGLYGIYLKEKHVFCGESMFSTISNASKYGFIALVRRLIAEHIKLIDCQVHSAHLESLGAELIPRREFLGFLK